MYIYRQSHGQTSAKVPPSSFLDHKDGGNFLGSVKKFPSLWQLPEDVLCVSKWDEYK